MAEPGSGQIWSMKFHCGRAVLISPSDYGRAGVWGSSDVGLCHLGILQAKAAGTMVQALIRLFLSLNLSLAALGLGIQSWKDVTLGFSVGVKH